jgi:enoyl-CoA hydratase
MITVEEHTGVAVVCLARPPVNALDLSMIEELESIFAHLANAAPRIGVVLTGAGNTFSAGVDTKAFVSYSREERRRMVLAITRMTAALLALPCPVIAAVNGHALGGGFVLMLCCDYRLVADEDALRLGLTEARAGVHFPAGPIAIMKHEMPEGLYVVQPRRQPARSGPTWVGRRSCEQGTDPRECDRCRAGPCLAARV